MAERLFIHWFARRAVLLSRDIEEHEMRRRAELEAWHRAQKLKAYAQTVDAFLLTLAHAIGFVYLAPIFITFFLCMTLAVLTMFVFALSPDTLIDKIDAIGRISLNLLPAIVRETRDIVPEVIHCVWRAYAGVIVDEAKNMGQCLLHMKYFQP